MDFLRDMHVLKARLDQMQGSLRQEKLRSRTLSEEAVALEAQVAELGRKARAREAEACKFEWCDEVQAPVSRSPSLARCFLRLSRCIASVASLLSSQQSTRVPSSFEAPCSAATSRSTRRHT